MKKSKYEIKLSQKCLFEDMDLGGYGWSRYLILPLYTASLSQASGTHTEQQIRN